MVILFSNRKNPTENEIVGILTSCGAGYISDKKIISDNTNFNVVSEYKKTNLLLKRCIAVFMDNGDRFKGQLFPSGTIGICEDSNLKALELFKENKIPVISCGMNAKNTITLSSLDKAVLVTLQRTITDINGKSILPGEYPINLSRSFSAFSVMASTAALLLHGVIPNKF